MNREPVSLLASIGLVLMCGAASAVGAVAELGTCFSHTGDSSPPGTRAAVVCVNPGAETVFNVGLVGAAIVALAGVGVGYVTADRRMTVTATWISLGLIGLLALWGFGIKTAIPGALRA